MCMGNSFQQNFFNRSNVVFPLPCKLFFSATLNESRCTRSHVQEKSNVTISQFCSMINTSICNNEDRVSRVISPKKNQEKPSDTSMLKSPKQKNISMSSKKKRQNDTSKPLHESVSMSPKKKKTVPEQSDSDIDIQIQIQKKNPNLKKTNQSFKSPIIKSKLKNAGKSITSDIHEEGNFFIIIVFKYGNRLNVKLISYKQMIKHKCEEVVWRNKQVTFCRPC